MFILVNKCCSTSTWFWLKLYLTVCSLIGKQSRVQFTNSVKSWKKFFRPLLPSSSDYSKIFVNLCLRKETRGLSQWGKKLTIAYCCTGLLWQISFGERPPWRHRRTRLATAADFCRWCHLQHRLRRPFCRSSTFEVPTAFSVRDSVACEVRKHSCLLSRSIRVGWSVGGRTSQQNHDVC